MSINPTMTVAGLNSKGNILERVEALEEYIRDIQIADQPDLNRNLLVANLILSPAPGVFVTDPTSTNYTGFFTSGNGREFDGNIYVTGNVVNGVIKTGFTDVGTLYAVNANIEGTITAGAGAIGGWLIDTSKIYSTNAVLSSFGQYISLGATPPTSYGSNVGMYMEGANGGRVSWYNDANNYLAWDSTKLLIKAANFTLDASGNITASNVTLTGSITATSGAIGGWTVNSTTIQKLSSNVGIILDSSIPAIKIGDTAGTYMLLDGANQVIKSSNYVSGLIGSSWTTSTGEAEFNNVTIRGAIKVTAMQYGYITATGGTNWVVPATGVLRDDTTSVDSPTTFAVNVKDPDGITHAAAGALWTVGDIIMLREPLTGVLYASISSKTDNTTYWTLNVVKQSPGAGTNYTFRAGLAIVNFGASGQGFISLSADGTVGSSPNITMATHAGSPWTTTSVRMRMGNLNGSYGYATNTYGVGIGQYGTAGQPSLTVDTTNGIRVISNTTTVGQWDTSGNIVVGQVSASQSNIQITSGGLNIRNNTTVLASWNASGVITIGQVTSSQNNIVISSGDISIRNNTTERIGITAAGILTIKDSGGAAVLTFDASTGAEITKKLTMTGASSAIALGNPTAPTANNTGTGLWIDRNGIYSLSSNTQNATLTSAGLTAAAGKTLINSLGIILTADVWPSTSRLYWTAADNSAVVGQAIGTYGGAAVNSGLVLYGRAHDSGVRGFVDIGAQDDGGVNKAEFILDSNGNASFDLTPTIGAAGAQALGISTKVTATNALNNVLYLNTDTSGTPAAGLGSSISFRTRDSAGNMQGIGFAGVPYITTTNGSEDSKFIAGFMRKGAFLGLPSSGNYATHTANTGNVTTGETDLFTDTLIAGLLVENGDHIIADYAGTTVAHATATRRIRVYFGGTVIYDTTALTTASAADWAIRVVCVRSSSTAVKCTVTFTAINYAGAVMNYQAVTGLTLSNTQIIKITGQAGGVGAATDDIVATFGVLNFFPTQ